MEGTSLLLDEAKFNSLEDSLKPSFVFEWLQGLDGLLSNLTSSKKSVTSPHERASQDVEKDVIRKAQKDLVAQLTKLIQNATAVGPTARQLIADCMVALFTVGDTFLLFETINK